MLPQSVSGLFLALLFVLAFTVVSAAPPTAIADTYGGSNDVTGWISYLQGHFPMPEYYLNPPPYLYVQASFDWSAPSMTLDRVAAEFTLPQVVSTESHTVGPGQVENVTLIVSFDPVYIVRENLGTIPLQLGQGGEYVIDESLWTGALGEMPDFTLTGDYTVDGPRSHESGSFSLELCSRPDRFFHFSTIQTIDYPYTVSLNGIDKSYEPHWYPKDAAPGQPLWQNVFFVDTEVDGYPVRAGVDYICIDTKTCNTINMVPEPGTLALVVIGVQCLILTQRRRTRSNRASK